ncbi:MAG: hypothetical protein KHX55_01635 [Proteobacteria bacterium]|nr:hypothetical protein [Pseudomonadota bacterium]
MYFEDEEEKRRQQTAQYINTPYGPARNPALGQKGTGVSNINDGMLQNKTNEILSRLKEPVNKVMAAANKMTPLELNDKYKHATVSCIGAQGGLYDAAVTGGMGLAKEGKDIIEKVSDRYINGEQKYGNFVDIITDSKNDLKTDFQGIKQGYLNPDEDCEEWMKRYYSPYWK